MTLLPIFNGLLVGSVSLLIFLATGSLVIQLLGTIAVAALVLAVTALALR